MEAVAKESGIDVEVVKRSDIGKGFVVQAWRWIVERTLGWLNRERRLSKDYERKEESSEAFIHFGHHPSHAPPPRLITPLQQPLRHRSQKSARGVEASPLPPGEGPKGTKKGPTPTDVPGLARTEGRPIFRGKAGMCLWSRVDADPPLAGSIPAALSRTRRPRRSGSEAARGPSRPEPGFVRPHRPTPRDGRSTPDDAPDAFEPPLG